MRSTTITVSTSRLSRWFQGLFAPRGRQRRERAESSAQFARSDSNDPIDDADLIHLDAEQLADGGIGRAYRRVQRKLQRFVAAVADMGEIEELDKPSYLVRFDAQSFIVFSPEIAGSERDRRHRAAVILSHIVNAQLGASPVRFYAVGRGQELHGIFLTPEIAASAQAYHEHESDRPLLLTLDMLGSGQRRTATEVGDAVA